MISTYPDVDMTSTRMVSEFQLDEMIPPWFQLDEMVLQRFRLRWFLHDFNSARDGTSVFSTRRDGSTISATIHQITHYGIAPTLVLLWSSRAFHISPGGVPCVICGTIVGPTVALKAPLFDTVWYDIK